MLKETEEETIMTTKRRNVAKRHSGRRRYRHALSSSLTSLYSSLVMNTCCIAAPIASPALIRYTLSACVRVCVLCFCSSLSVSVSNYYLCSADPLPLISVKKAHTNILPYIHTCIHPYIHTYIQYTYMIYVHICICI